MFTPVPVLRFPLAARYRKADIDPVIVQPVACVVFILSVLPVLTLNTGSYRVDRRKSVEVLRSFLKQKDRKIVEEREWLHSVNADCVLSDAAFLGW